MEDKGEGMNGKAIDSRILREMVLHVEGRMMR